MPYKSDTEKIKIPRQYDRRVKITEEHKVEIKKLYDSGMAIRAIAREFEAVCSRRSIQIILRPELKEHLAKAFIERKKDGRYTPGKSEWAATMREHRAYKYNLYKAGKL